MSTTLGTSNAHTQYSLLYKLSMDFFKIWVKKRFIRKNLERSTYKDYSSTYRKLYWISLNKEVGKGKEWMSTLGVLMFRTSITEMSTLAMTALSSHWRAYSIEIHFLLKKKKKKEEMKQTANIFDRQFNSRRKDSIETRKGRVQQKYAQWTKYCRTREAKHQIIERWGYVSHLYNIALFLDECFEIWEQNVPFEKTVDFLNKTSTLTLTARWRIAKTVNRWGNISCRNIPREEKSGDCACLSNRLHHPETFIVAFKAAICTYSTA